MARNLFETIGFRRGFPHQLFAVFIREVFHTIALSANDVVVVFIGKLIVLRRSLLQVYAAHDMRGGKRFYCAI